MNRLLTDQELLHIVDHLSDFSDENPYHRSDDEADVNIKPNNNGNENSSESDSDFRKFVKLDEENI